MKRTKSSQIKELLKTRRHHKTDKHRIRNPDKLDAEAKRLEALIVKKIRIETDAQD